MNRRAFFRLLGISAGAIALAPVLPMVAAAPVAAAVAPSLQFHPDAFAFVMDPITLAEFRKKYTEPAGRHIAARMDADMLRMLNA